MKRIGLLIAVEMDAILNSDYQLLEKCQVGKFEVYKYQINNQEIIAIHSGIGQVYAAAASEILISLFKVDVIINFGVAGSLSDDLGLASICLVKGLVDYQYDVSKIDNVEPARHENYPDVVIETNKELRDLVLSLHPSLPQVNCASGHVFVEDKKEKERLFKEYHCSIVEMEAIGIQLIADMHDVPVLYIKGISDNVLGGAAQYSDFKNKVAKLCLEIVDSLFNKL